jgi:ABC-type cobalt transport system substrate-binding protein
MRNLLIYTTILITLVLVFALALNTKEENVLGEDEKIEERINETLYDLEIPN